MADDAKLRQVLSIIRTRLCTRTPFFGSLTLFAQVKVSTHVPTAATDGRDIFINLDFFGRLTLAEQEGVFLHEVLHAALLHVPRGRGREKLRWNIAADVVVNGILAKEGYAMPEGSIRVEELEYLSAEEVYDLLEQNSDILSQCQLQNPDLLTQSPDEGRFGHHEMEVSSERQASLEQYWRNAREQASVVAQTSMYGTLPAHMLRELDRLKASQLNWRQYLWRYLIQTPVDFSGFDRRFIGRRLYLDSLEGESVQVIVAVDTSGSIMEEQLQQFLGEVLAILQAYPHLKCDLYYIDTDPQGPYALTAYSSVPPPTGGGGTDFQPIFDLIPRDYDVSNPLVAVYLTDGYGQFPEIAPSFPTLWIVTPGGLDASYFPFGEVVRLVD